MDIFDDWRSKESRFFMNLDEQWFKPAGLNLLRQNISHFGGKLGDPTGVKTMALLAWQQVLYVCLR
jgi:hypothetical protein